MQAELQAESVESGALWSPCRWNYSPRLSGKSRKVSASCPGSWSAGLALRAASALPVSALSPTALGEAGEAGLNVTSLLAAHALRNSQRTSCQEVATLSKSPGQPRIGRPKVEAMASPCTRTEIRPTSLPSTLADRSACTSKRTLGT